MGSKIQNFLNDLFVSLGGWYEVVATAAALILIYLFFSVVWWVVRVRLRKTAPDLIELVRYYLYIPLLVLFWIIGFIILKDNLFFLTRKASKVIDHFLYIGLISSTAFVVIQFIRGGRILLLKRVDFSDQSNLKARRIYTQTRIFGRIITVIVIIVAISFILMSFTTVRRVGISLLASAGVVGIILGFATQKTLTTIISGIQLAFSQPVRIGDTIVVDGYLGTVEEITLTHVVMLTWDRKYLVIPITHFLEKIFENWTRHGDCILGTALVSVDFSIPIEEFREKVKKFVENSPNWDGQRFALVVYEAKERWIELRATVSASDADKLWDLRCEVREFMVQTVQKEYPHCMPKQRVQSLN